MKQNHRGSKLPYDLVQFYALGRQIDTRLTLAAHARQSACAILHRV